MVCQKRGHVSVYCLLRQRSEHPPPPTYEKKFFADFWRIFFVLDNFRCAYHKIQNGLKRMFLIKKIGIQEIFLYFRKISGKISKVLTDTLVKISQNIFSYFSVSEHSASFSLYKNKNNLVADRGLTPPLQSTDQSATNIFLRLPSPSLAFLRFTQCRYIERNQHQQSKPFMKLNRSSH